MRVAALAISVFALPLAHKMWQFAIGVGPENPATQRCVRAFPAFEGVASAFEGSRGHNPLLDAVSHPWNITQTTLVPQVSEPPKRLLWPDLDCVSTSLDTLR